MKSIELILKGILLWVSVFIVMLSICSINSIIYKGCSWFFSIIVLNIILILACIIYITEEEYKIISGYNLLSKILKLDKELF